MTSLKTSIKTITYLSDTGCLEIQGASLIGVNISFVIIWFISHEKTHIRLLSAFLVGITWPMSLPVALLFSLF
ncbi:putative inner membrane protein [Escherichia coli]|nr:putative inner membrane protein [Escherichia coli]